jgi:hypothetical protein
MWYLSNFFGGAGFRLLLDGIVSAWGEHESCQQNKREKESEWMV